MSWYILPLSIQKVLGSLNPISPGFVKRQMGVLSIKQEELQSRMSEVNQRLVGPGEFGYLNSSTSPKNIPKPINGSTMD